MISLSNKLALLVCFAASLAFGQGSSPLSTPIAFGPLGQLIPGATVAICTSKPTAVTPCGGSSLLQTSVDQTLGVNCTLNPGALSNLNGAGCTNPGFADSVANVIAYANGGAYWCQYYGGAISGVQVYPCPFLGQSFNVANTGNFAVSNSELSYVSSDVGALNINPQWLFQQSGTPGELDALVGAILTPLSATVLNASAVAGWAQSTCNSVTRTVCNTLAGYFNAVANANGAAIWGTNPVVTDRTATSNTSLTGTEIDIGVFGTPQYVTGLDLNLTCGATGPCGTMPSNSAGINLTNAPASGGLRYQIAGIVIGSTVAQNHAIQIGQQATGSSANSLDIQFLTNDSGGTQRNLFYRALGGTNPPIFEVSSGASAGAGPGLTREVPTTFANIPSCTSSIEGSRAAITDDNTSGTWGSTEGGGSAGHHVGIYCDGTNWTVYAK